MADTPDKENLIRLVTEAVSARLEKKAVAEKKTLLLLLPEPISSLRTLVEQVVSWRAEGWRVLVLAAEKVAHEADARVLRGRLGDEVHQLEEVLLGEWLERLEQVQMVLLGGIGFSAARRLCQLEDSEPWVRLVLRALLRARPVLVVTDELESLPAARESGATREARKLLGELERLGTVAVPFGQLPAELQRRAADTASAGRALGGLLSESAVEQLHRSGAKQITVTAGTLVTPLARSRAAELGIELVFEE